MTEKKRPPRFDDIAALSKQPPAKKPSGSIFALAYDAEQARRAGLAKVSEADVVAATTVDTNLASGVNNKVDTNLAIDTNQTIDTNQAIDTNQTIDTNQAIDTRCPVDARRQYDTNVPVDANRPQVDTKIGANPFGVDAKVTTPMLTPTINLATTPPLTPTVGLTPKKKNPPSWRMSRLSIRLDKEKLNRLHFVAMSRGITLQDLIGGWADAFLADEGLTPTQRLTPLVGWHQTDQMTNDVVGTSTSSILERPEELLNYYAKWTANPIRENDWQAMRMALSYTPMAIKAGILMSILRTKTKVNSFKYCLGAIDEVAKAGIIGTADHVRYLEVKVEKAREGK